MSARFRSPSPINTEIITRNNTYEWLRMRENCWVQGAPRSVINILLCGYRISRSETLLWWPLYHSSSESWSNCTFSPLYRHLFKVFQNASMSSRYAAEYAAWVHFSWKLRTKLTRLKLSYKMKTSLKIHNGTSSPLLFQLRQSSLSLGPHSD